MSEKSPIILNRATGSPKRKPKPSPEVGAWRSLTTILVKMREQIAAISAPKAEIGDVVPSVENMPAREITINGVTFTAFVKDDK